MEMGAGGGGIVVRRGPGFQTLAEEQLLGQPKTILNGGTNVWHEKTKENNDLILFGKGRTFGPEA